MNSWGVTCLEQKFITRCSYSSRLFYKLAVHRIRCIAVGFVGGEVAIKMVHIHYYYETYLNLLCLLSLC